MQIRFNNSDVVTGGRGYNAWWSKEYERREACDLYTKFSESNIILFKVAEGMTI